MRSACFYKFCALSLLCLFPRQASAQAKVLPPTLAAALAASPPRATVVLTTGADHVPLPKAALPLGPQASTGEIADDYGRLTQRFGAVMAVAPMTMTLINTAPGEPNIYEGMPALDALTLLLATLTDTQWHALTGETGLALSDLDGGRQRALFAATLAPGGRLKVVPKHSAGEPWDTADDHDLTDELPQAHLRLGQTLGLELPSKDGAGYFPFVKIPPPPGERQYEVSEVARQDDGSAANRVYGQTVRADVPNVAKRGQLDFSAPGLRASVPLAGLKTVGDLVTRIGNITHTELYADRRLETQTVTTTGTPSAPAADLLRALALCLTGTYRQVGPAYVLTDDVLGLGTRKQLWLEFERQADALRRVPVREAQSLLAAKHPPAALSWFGSPLALTPEQRKQGNPGSVDVNLSLSLPDMTPAQQELVQRTAENWNREFKTQQTTLDKKVTLEAAAAIQLLVPSIPTPIDLNINNGNSQLSLLFAQTQTPEEKKAERDQQLKQAQDEMAKLPPPAPLSAVLALLDAVPDRAVYVHPATAADVDADVAAMRVLHLNRLWLDVFSGGTAHIPGFALSSAKPINGNDILTEALHITKGTPIRVFAVLNLLDWGQSPPQSVRDLTVLGETSTQADAREQQISALVNGTEDAPDPNVPALPYTTPLAFGVAVSPAAPDVRADLAALVGALAARPDVAGLVWRATVTLGYDDGHQAGQRGDVVLGYAEPGRLAFLRQAHADPVDVFPSGEYQNTDNTDLPNFSSQDSGPLDTQWTQFRAQQNLMFLRRLYGAALTARPATAPKLRLLLKQRRAGQMGNMGFGRHYYSPGWYGSWDNPAAPPPTLHSDGEDYTPGQPMPTFPPEDVQARQQSRLVLTPLPLAALEQLTPLPLAALEQLRRGLAQSRTAFRQHSPAGFVLDMSDDPAGDRALRALAASLPHPARAK